jgi:type 1 fimbria pilin
VIRRARCVLLSAVLVAMIAALPHAASAAVFKTSISGKQELTWKLDGTTGNCEIRRGTGNGTVSFRFKSTKPAPAFSASGGKLSFTVSIPSVATGSIAGTFTDKVETPCPGFEPREPFSEDVSGCGATRFGVRADVVSHGAFLYVTGPNTPLGPVSISQAGGYCPFPLGGSSWDTSLDRSGCGDGKQLWKRSWGVSSSGGEGLLASRIHMTPKQLRRKKLTITGRASVDCTIPSQYTGGVKLIASLKYTLSLKRMG